MTPLETVEALRSLGAYHVLVIDGDKRIEAQFRPSADAIEKAELE